MINKTTVKVPVLILTLVACAVPAFSQHRSADEEFTMALTGDSIINRKVSVYD